MTLKERLQWMFRMALMLFILASVAFLSGLTAMRFAIQGRVVSMPDVVGKKIADAQQILGGRGLLVEVEDRIYNALPADCVVRQSPPPGIQVKIGEYAHVVLSLGPQKMTIPDLEDRSQQAARIELLRSGMQVGEIAAAYLPGYETDAVIQQEPPAGTTDVTSPHVDLLVSLGPRPAAYVMPAVDGLTLGEAESRLASGGLKVSKVTLGQVTGEEHGTVYAQTPPRGQRVDGTTSIELQVAE